MLTLKLITGTDTAVLIRGGLIQKFYKNLFLIKNAYLLDTFLGGFFFFETKAKQIFSVLFDIYFKFNLVVPLGFKVINVKILHSKNLEKSKT